MTPAARNQTSCGTDLTPALVACVQNYDNGASELSQVKLAHRQQLAALHDETSQLKTQVCSINCLVHLVCMLATPYHLCPAYAALSPQFPDCGADVIVMVRTTATVVNSVDKHSTALLLLLFLQLADAHAAAAEARHHVEAARAEVHALLAAREGGSSALRAKVGCW